MRTVIRETLADLDDETAEIVLTSTGWAALIASCGFPAGGVGNATARPRISLLRSGQLSLIITDDVIAGGLNRNGLRTGTAIAGHGSDVAQIEL